MFLPEMHKTILIIDVEITEAHPYDVVGLSLSKP